MYYQNVFCYQVKDLFVVLTDCPHEFLSDFSHGLIATNAHKVLDFNSNKSLHHYLQFHYNLPKHVLQLMLHRIKLQRIYSTLTLKFLIYYD